jgi:hypothetical protein
LLPEQLTLNTVAQAEVNLNFGVCERLLAQKLGSVRRFSMRNSQFALDSLSQTEALAVRGG